MLYFLIIYLQEFPIRLVPLNEDLDYCIFHLHLKKIIEIFSEVPLNSNKQLNFLSFKKAFELYTKFKIKDTKLQEQILDIRSSMNRHN